MTLLLFLIDRCMVFSVHSMAYKHIDEVPVRQVILVPGARVYAGEVSAILRERLDAAIELYQAGKAAKILVSGDYSSHYYDEASAMSRFLRRKGIDPTNILLDYAGFSTYDSVLRARDVFGVRSLIIVTQDFHLPRALFIARALGIDVVGFSASRHSLLPATILRNDWREPLARFKALYDVLVHTKPAFSGSGLPIDDRGKVLRPS